MMEDESSLMTVTQLIMAPEITPGSIMGSITSSKERNSEAPRETAASSIEGEIWEIIAVLERIVYGILRTVSAMIMIHAVPVRARGFFAKAYRKQIPSTDPGAYQAWR